MKAVAKSMFVRLLLPAVFALLTACLGESPSADGNNSSSDNNTPIPAHINSFTASNDTITAGQSVTLSWSVTNATSLSIDPGFASVSGDTGSVTVTPTSTTTYTLKAVNAAGQSVSSSLTVTVNTPAPDSPQISLFTASSSTITAGQSVTLSWSVTNATSLSITPGFASLSGSSVTVTPASTTTYTLQAVSAAGQSVSSSLTVTVVPPPQISSFTASSSTITAGQSVTLSWSVTNATSLSITPGFASLSGNTGSVTATPASTTTYTLRAVNAAGQNVSSALTVTVVPSAQISSFTASSSTITAGQSVTLSWSVTNATSLSITPGFASLSGSSVTVTPTSTTTYTLQAANAAGQSVSSSLTVTVVPPPQIGSFTASSTTITSGQSVTLSWNVTNATTRSITPGFASLGTNSGSVTATPTTTTTYTLQAANAAGQSVSSSLTVTVNTPPQVISFTASPQTIHPDGTSTLSWNVTGATSLSISPGDHDVSGDTALEVSPTDTTTYTLTAIGSGGSTTRQVTVTVNNGSATGHIYDSSIFASESGLTDADWALLTEGRFFFAHQSVGYNIMQGFGALGRDNSHYAINDQYPWTSLVNISGPYLFNMAVGENYHPYTKIAGFDALVRDDPENENDPAAGGQVDVALMKFCFVDFNEATDVTALANAYIDEMDALESAFPTTKFLWTTAPLTNEADAANAIRNQFAERIRTYALANGKRVYDIAALEATNADGSRCTFTLGGVTYDHLCAAWEEAWNNPHLNTDGGMRLARALGLALIDMRKQ